MDHALRCEGISKAFAGVPVLDAVSLDLDPGTVTALAGENGAGKSTLMKIVCGQVRADAGRVVVGGRTLDRADPREAGRLGVAIVPQELAPIRDLTVAQNLLLGREPHTRLGLLDRRGMVEQARTMLAPFDVDIDPTTPMRRLSVALCQLVEIAKSVGRGAQVLLLDEPTSAISEREVVRLHGIVDTLRRRGVAVLYTTHRMEEIRAVADRVVVLRDGALALDSEVARCTDDQIVHAMIGRELDGVFPARTTPAPAEPVLEVDRLRVGPTGEPVSFAVRPGEVVGLAGLVGAGRTELLEAVFGVRPRLGGEVRVAGRALRPRPAAAVAAGVALVPEDRKGAGLVLSMNVLDNGSLPRLADFSRAGWLRPRFRRNRVAGSMRSVGLRSRGLTQGVDTLSGGNQQKVVLARWLTGQVRVLLLDEPTRGVDVGARSEIYRLVAELAAAGMAVVLASSDMPEVLGMSDRVLVLRRGAVAGELDRTALDAPDAQRTVFGLAAGLDGAGPDGADPDGTGLDRLSARAGENA